MPPSPMRARRQPSAVSGGGARMNARTEYQQHRLDLADMIRAALYVTRATDRAATRPDSCWTGRPATGRRSAGRYPPGDAPLGSHRPCAGTRTTCAAMPSGGPRAAGC